MTYEEALSTTLSLLALCPSYGWQRSPRNLASLLCLDPCSEGPVTVALHKVLRPAQPGEGMLVAGVGPDGLACVSRVAAVLSVSQKEQMLTFSVPVDIDRDDTTFLTHAYEYVDSTKAALVAQLLEWGSEVQQYERYTYECVTSSSKP